MSLSTLSVPLLPEPHFLFLFFSPSEKSQAAGRAFWERRHQRQGQDQRSSVEAMKGQIAAITGWHAPRDDDFAYLKEITQPTLVVNGHTDIMVPTKNSFILQQYIPDAQLILYPDSGHGSQFQYPLQFVQQTVLFLDPPAEPV
ncbi:alpha/beta fold hydrolase [Pseudomonas cannabina]|uniref:Alpha/beta fold hydrolase n=1 Tax=Pseudomonas syringae pv. maculicola str. ES4326 TaxID=629265 RepID=A0A8T8BW82_PSEYM|nr:MULTISPECIES: alpha/beta fold hydrolase [Pseudomonas syringae group]QHE95601.1 alpha/beta fold hydrolase [Pseudomonas syringae pv. maculicola str. ES4326]QQN22791.1 alpha/beta hydrolase [Pseudomonas cannabina pv. alisalensis]UBY96227.1 alpha/beta fold hydrolase [Pseudomonas cannabina pv. alisalensis]